MLDHQKINQLRKDLGAEGFAEIVDIFFAEVEEVFGRIQADGASATDMHFLKGSGANVGFTAFSKTCQIVEHSLNEGGRADLDAVRRSFAKSKQAFVAEFLEDQS